MRYLVEIAAKGREKTFITQKIDLGFDDFQIDSLVDAALSTPGSTIRIKPLSSEHGKGEDVPKG